MTAYKLVNVRRRKRSIGKSCLHCGRSATVTVDRVRIAGGLRVPLALCEEDFEHLDKIVNETRDV